jgi:UDP-GlcNAc3NAcA epimerase
MTCKVITIVGARPQFIKAAAISRAILLRSDDIQEVVIHTGQHYDANMSQVFFDELEIPAPKYNLHIAGGGHGAMTGRMLEGIEKILVDEQPDWVLIYGDTNSTLAGALAAVKMHIPVAHVEAGLRSFNMDMPEEINRILADRVSTLLLCPTDTAVANLANEGVRQGVSNVGDVMYDVALYYRERARVSSSILARLGLEEKRFALATCHRAENTDVPERLREILLGLSAIGKELPVVLPLHPRTRKLVTGYALEDLLEGLIVVEPLSFLDMVALEQAARVILTDSGGVQKEAYFYGVPCITMRDETEWVETVSSGWNTLVGASSALIAKAYAELDVRDRDTSENPYGHGDASRIVVESILSHHR